MTVEIDKFDTEVEILSGQSATRTEPRGPDSAAPCEATRLKALLRPIVLQILEEEMDDYQRLRG